MPTFLIDVFLQKLLSMTFIADQETWAHKNSYGSGKRQKVSKHFSA